MKKIDIFFTKKIEKMYKNKLRSFIVFTALSLSFPLAIIVLMPIYAQQYKYVCYSKSFIHLYPCFWSGASVVEMTVFAMGILYICIILIKEIKIYRHRFKK
jgi:hypothetical protein